MEKFSLLPDSSAIEVLSAGIERVSHLHAPSAEVATKPKTVRAISQRTLANLVKGARAGGFVPLEIVLETSGEVRLMAERGQSARVEKSNDFDREFG